MLFSTTLESSDYIVKHFWKSVKYGIIAGVFSYPIKLYIKRWLSGAFEDPVEQKRLELINRKDKLTQRYNSRLTFQETKYYLLNDAESRKDEHKKDYIIKASELRDDHEKSIEEIDSEIEKIEKDKSRYQLSITDLLKLKIQEPIILITSSIIATSCAMKSVYHFKKFTKRGY